MFTVEGEIAGQPYSVTVDGPVQPGWSYGCATGSDDVIRLLQTREGSGYAATPTGPFGTLDCKDPAAVLGALLDWTRVKLVHGDYPGILGEPGPPGTVY